LALRIFLNLASLALWAAILAFLLAARTLAAIFLLASLSFLFLNLAAAALLLAAALFLAAILLLLAASYLLFLAASTLNCHLVFSTLTAFPGPDCFV